MTTELNELFIQKFLKDLDAIDTQFMEGVTDAVLYTRYKGDGKLAVKIAEMLKAKLGRDVKITEEEEKGVVAGVALKFGTMLVDGTLASKLRENAEKLKLEMEK
jgi:F0F1-type ATP synthase delta subunit